MLLEHRILVIFISLYAILFNVRLKRRVVGAVKPFSYNTKYTTVLTYERRDSTNERKQPATDTKF